MKIEITQEEMQKLTDIAKAYQEDKSEENLKKAYLDSGIKLEEAPRFLSEDQGEQIVGCVPCAACVIPPDPPIFAIAFGFLA